MPNRLLITNVSIAKMDTFVMSRRFGIHSSLGQVEVNLQSSDPLAIR